MSVRPEDRVDRPFQWLPPMACAASVPFASKRCKGPMTTKLRIHQRQVDAVMRAIAGGETEVRDILAAVTPGGGKSLLPVLSAARLIRAGTIDKVCWIVPRDTLRLQAEEAFADAHWRTALDHAVSVRAADNRPDPSRGLGGYVTTYQAIAAAPELHLREFQSHRYLIAVDELHHLPAINDLDAFSPVAEETSWSRSIRPLLELARIRLLMSGTLERADGRAILWLPYKSQRRTETSLKFRRIDFDQPHWAVVGYSRRQALAEKAVIPVTFGAMDGMAEWKPKKDGSAPAPEGPIPLSAEPGLARYALYTALRTGFAEEMLRMAFDDCRAHRQRRRALMQLGVGQAAPGLGKLLVVASDQAVARHYADLLESWFPARDRSRAVRTAMSSVPDAQEAIAAFRLRPDPSVLVTVAMAYEGMDAVEVSHVCALTHIRSRPWLEQMIARATRVDPNGGAWEQQKATVYHPDDLLFRRFRHAIETEQGTKARFPGPHQGNLLDPEENPDADSRDWGLGIEPISSNVTTIRFDRVRPGPDFATLQDKVATMADHDNGETAAVLRPSDIERRLRQRLGQMVAGQVVEDEASFGVGGAVVSYHAYNAVLKRQTGGRSRVSLKTDELEAAIAWMERNRISDHLGTIEGDPQYKWSDRRQKIARQTPGSWATMLERHYTKAAAKAKPAT
jgi:superfamily II DNA or RNA helicase